MELLVWLAETPQGLWGVDAGLFSLCCCKWRGESFHKMK